MTASSDVDAPDRDPIWPLLGWVIFSLASAVLLVAVMVGSVMRAVVLDVVSFWPAWILAVVIAGALWPLHRKGVARVGAIAPLLLFSWLTGAVGLHYSGWEQLPSAAGDLVGPELAGAETAALSIDVSGTLILSPGSDRLYEVELIRSGGSTGPAEALERRTDDDVVVRLLERPDAGWFESDGWDVVIARTPVWALTLAAGDLDVDLGTVSISSLGVIADGQVRLASPVGTVPVTINGSVTLRVPRSANVEVIGSVETPDGWERTETGARVVGEGTSLYMVTVVSGASLIVEYW